MELNEWMCNFNVIAAKSIKGVGKMVWALYKNMMLDIYDPLGLTSTFGDFWDENGKEVPYEGKVKAKTIKKHLLNEYSYFYTGCCKFKKLDLSEFIAALPEDEKDIQDDVWGFDGRTDKYIKLFERKVD